MSSYQALVNISHPRRGDANKETDLIEPGETFDLTDDEAARYLPPMRIPAVIRPAKESGEPMPELPPMKLFGVAINQRTGKPVGRPRPPADARPDPPGSSEVLVPEAAEPQPGDENALPDDAVDIPPAGRARARAAAAAKGR